MERPPGTGVLVTLLDSSGIGGGVELGTTMSSLKASVREYSEDALSSELPLGGWYLCLLV